MERVRCEGARYEPRTTPDDDDRAKAIAAAQRTKGSKPAQQAEKKAPMGPPLPPDSPGKDALIKQRAAGRRRVPDATPAKAKASAGPVTKEHFGKVHPGPDGTTELGVVRTRVGNGQLEGEATIARGRTKDGTQADLGGVRAHVGVRNPDGSVGLNAGVTGTVAGVEKKIEMGSTSVGVGVSKSVGASVSVGVRDKDGDGAPELCQSVSALWFSGSVCMEGIPGNVTKAIVDAIRD